ncbi:MAG: ferredoxin family protein [Aeropyrum sp.]|nr:ferredoxin family protein [Aeropyrum sp.]MCE4616607.1 ferredoxin family protein [Aeropyrum sp.]
MAQSKMLSIEDILQRNVWDVAEDPHIEIPKGKENQRGIPKKALALLCPAACYTMVGEELLFSYEGCVECGLCRVITPKDKIKWTYPRSGRGIQYRFT